VCGVGLYQTHVLPRLVDRLCGNEAIGELRAAVVPRAAGRVLEVGFGTGLNLRWYDASRVERLIALEPAPEMLARARERSRAAPFPVEPVALEGERIPLEPASVDSVVVTFTLCTIPEPLLALEGMRRVLRPGGRLLFLEHGRAPDERVARWQARWNPLWSRVFGGCRLDRDVPALLRAGGFRIDELESAWVPGAPRIAGFCHRGSASPAP
jgi:ubiquinone/menaquinone biosynthesis C-methylase UbiE